MPKLIHPRGPHRCEVCGRVKATIKTLNPGFASYYCCRECWNEKEAEEAGKE